MLQIHTTLNKYNGKFQDLHGEFDFSIVTIDKVEKTFKYKLEVLTILFRKCYYNFEIVFL